MKPVDRKQVLCCVLGEGSFAGVSCMVCRGLVRKECAWSKYHVNLKFRNPGETSCTQRDLNPQPCVYDNNTEDGGDSLFM